jgi:hypothetical protein
MLVCIQEIPWILNGLHRHIHTYSQKGYKRGSSGDNCTLQQHCQLSSIQHLEQIIETIGKTDSF